MKTAVQVVVFVLDGVRLALPLSAVERVVRAVEVTPLPQAPPTTLGVINVHGQVVPVVDLRKLLGLRSRDVEPSDYLVIARISSRTMALLVDDVQSVMEFPGQDFAAAEPGFPRLGAVQGVLKADSGVIPICDIERFLSLEEHDLLERSLHTGGVPP